MLVAQYDIYQPFNVSDHASWSASGNAHLNDLLPLPYTQESLNKLARNIEHFANGGRLRLLHLLGNLNKVLVSQGLQLEALAGKFLDFVECFLLGCLHLVCRV